MRTAPVAPSGWPCAMAPPSGLTRAVPSRGLSSFTHARTTGAKASLISKTEMSSTLSPARARAFCVAGMTPSSMTSGSEPTTTRVTIRARLRSPSSSAFGPDARSTAAAPSETCDALPAVTQPSSALKMVLSFAIAAGSTDSRTPSSTAKVRSTPVESVTLSGMICDVNAPARIAAVARRCDCTANASHSARLIPYFSATSSADWPWCMSWYGNVDASLPSAAIETSLPIFSTLIISQPPAATSSMSPDAIACAAKWIACCAEPHIRLICTAAVVTGNPA
eukprot:Amastigsp_a679908_35.p2 type:complete len:280 gc:universal Amastigsp_a679908_35:118-957(+)